VSSTFTGASRTGGPSDGLAAADRDELRHRGVTVIADQVFEKIARQAAGEVSTSRSRSGGVLGFGSGGGSRPKVDVELSADSVDLDLAVSIAYPGSIRAAAQRIRENVSSRVQDLTGVPVHRVDLDVTYLTVVDSAGELSAGDRRGRRKQVLR
jgi:uncharacterized alkaline shock family protein YloU